MKDKKPQTANQKKNKARVLQYTCNAGSVVSILTPFITLGIVNYEEWFTTEEGWKVGLGGALALALMGIAIWLFAKKKEGNNDITNGWITMIVGWFAATFILFLLSSIINQISTIMLWGGFGILGAFGLDVVAKKQKEKADMYKTMIKAIKQEKEEREIREEEGLI